MWIRLVDRNVLFLGLCQSDCLISQSFFSSKVQDLSNLIFILFPNFSLAHLTIREIKENFTFNIVLLSSLKLIVFLFSFFSRYLFSTDRQTAPQFKCKRNLICLKFSKFDIFLCVFFLAINTLSKVNEHVSFEHNVHLCFVNRNIFHLSFHFADSIFTYFLLFPNF